jgi:hypothetical protein
MTAALLDGETYVCNRSCSRNHAHLSIAYRHRDSLRHSAVERKKAVLTPLARITRPHERAVEISPIFELSGNAESRL